MKTAILLSLACCLPAHAEDIRVEYTGVVSRLSYADCQTLVNGSCTAWSFTSIQSSDFFDGNAVSVGNQFSGSFVYDTSAPLTAISSDGFQAVHLNAVSEAIFQAGALSVPAPLLPNSGAGSYSIVNDRNGYDSFYVNNTYSLNDWFASVNFHLQDSTGSVFSNFDVPASLDFAAFNANAFNVGLLRRSDGDQVQLFGDLRSATFTAAVPEPSSFAYLIAGGLLLFLVRASKKSLFRTKRPASIVPHA